MQQVRNLQGDVWRVEVGQSRRLAHIDGYLVTYGNTGRIILSARLASDELARARAALMQQLAQIPVGTTGATLWSQDDPDVLRTMP